MSDQQNAASAQPQNNGKRKRMMTLLVAVIVIAAIAYGLYYFLVARFHEDTDDAYVNGNVVQITPQVTGTVIAVKADDTQTVKAGDPLVVLDPADSQVALQQAEANLAQTVRQVRGLFVNDDQYRAQVALRQSDLSKAQDDLRRRLAVAQTGAVSQEEISHARDAVKAAQASVDAAQQQLASNRALTANTTIASHPNVMAAAAKVRDAYLANARNVLPAPVTGYVAKRSVQVGQRVSPGNPLMSVVPLNAVWVDANFKEVQLKHMRIGQPVEMTADIYGSSVTYHGKVVGFSAGTGSAFSLLPAQNAPATGSRSCSACRCGSNSIRRISTSIRCASACRCRSTWTSRTNAATSSSTRRTPSTRPTCSRNTATKPTPKSRASSPRTQAATRRRRSRRSRTAPRK